MRRGRWGKDKIGEKRVEGELRVLITQRRLLLYIPRFPKSHMLWIRFIIDYTIEIVRAHFCGQVLPLNLASNVVSCKLRRPNRDGEKACKAPFFDFSFACYPSWQTAYNTKPQGSNYHNYVACYQCSFLLNLASVPKSGYPQAWLGWLLSRHPNSEHELQLCLKNGFVSHAEPFALPKATKLKWSNFVLVANVSVYVETTAIQAHYFYQAKGKLRNLDTQTPPYHPVS